jgi:hypothetical protein
VAVTGHLTGCVYACGQDMVLQCVLGRTRQTKHKSVRGQEDKENSKF